MSTPKNDKQIELAKQIAQKIKEPQREAVRKWIEQLLELKNSKIRTTEKAKKAIALTANSPFISTVATLIANAATPSGLRDLSDKLIEINNSNLGHGAKLAQATKTISKGLKSTAWDNRGLAARLAMSGAIAGAVFFGGQGAGIAALGSAIGVPLWIVFGAGAGFIGILYDEISGKKTNIKTTYTVIDAEKKR